MSSHSNQHPLASLSAAASFHKYLYDSSVRSFNVSLMRQQNRTNVSALWLIQFSLASQHKPNSRVQTNKPECISVYNRRTSCSAICFRWKQHSALNHGSTYKRRWYETLAVEIQMLSNSNIVRHCFVKILAATSGSLIR